MLWLTMANMAFSALEAADRESQRWGKAIRRNGSCATNPQTTTPSQDANHFYFSRILKRCRKYRNYIEEQGFFFCIFLFPIFVMYKVINKLQIFFTENHFHGDHWAMISFSWLSENHTGGATVGWMRILGQFLEQITTLFHGQPSWGKDA